MTIFVTWQLIVTLDSIRISYDVCDHCIIFFTVKSPVVWKDASVGPQVGLIWRNHLKLLSSLFCLGKDWKPNLFSGEGSHIPLCLVTTTQPIHLECNG